MKKLQRLGQHFLTSEKIAKQIVATVKLADKDVVLEIGTGTGILTLLLCEQAAKVISYEVDKKLYEEALRVLSETNLELKHGDGFKSKENFTVFVSNLPYSKSRDAIEWLIQKKFSKAIVMVQKEFAEKLQAKSKKKRKAISVLAQYALDIEPIISVNKINFKPQPKIDSIVLKLSQKNIVSKKLIETVNKLFSYRRKTIQNIMKQFEIETNSKKRLDDLSGDEIIKIAQQIIK